MRRFLLRFVGLYLYVPTEVLMLENAEGFPLRRTGIKCLLTPDGSSAISIQRASCTEIALSNYRPRCHSSGSWWLSYG